MKKLGWKKKVKILKRDVYALYLAFKDKRVPWYTKAFIICIVGYALSPIDFIPDFIPVLGYVDDLIIIPLGILLAVKMIPPEVLKECRSKAEREIAEKKPEFKITAILFIVIWLGVVYIVVRNILRIIKK